MQDKEVVINVFPKYKIYDFHTFTHDESPIRGLIDSIEDKRKYVDCVYLLNKIYQISLNKINILIEKPYVVIFSCNFKINFNRLFEKI